MIEEIRLRGLGVIDDAALEPHPGFTALTGETGAGKTMVLTGLALLLGGRADAGAVRSGAARAEVEGRLHVDLPAVLDRVHEAGGELDDGAVLVARTVTAEGRSRAHLGGRSVPASVLAEIADDLVAVHGQSDQQRLLAPSRQRAALDRYAGPPVTDLLGDYRGLLDRLRRVEHDLAEITGHARERAQEADLLRLGLTEIEAVDPVPGEDAALAAEAARLAHAEALREAALSAHASLRADDDAPDALGLLALARRSLDAVREHDAELGRLADRVADAAVLLADVSADLAGYAASAESDPARLAAVEERRAALTALTRKYGATVEEVLAWSGRAALRLGEVDGDDERLAGLAAQRAQLRERLGELAGRISAARRAAGERFAAAVSAELVELAMPHAQVHVELRHAESADGLEVVLDGAARRVAFGPSGVDEVELLLVPHAGAPARPLAKGASGGELSRVMLAVEVVLAGTEPVPTLVFDEVDAGVGGRAAVEVGRRLARLARSSQVLVVTHLPQVAAFADRQVVVRKSDDGRVTTSDLRVVADEDRVRELARMLAGLEGSESAAAHAQELLDLAAADRAAPGAPGRGATVAAGTTAAAAAHEPATADRTEPVTTPRRRRARA
ncbi:MAG: DNA repair protein RecN [Frankiales bacterium]|nr:DNA repair protein RecN [Frankiales bacterium]